MSRSSPRVTVTYSGSTGYDLKNAVGGIVDDLAIDPDRDPTDEQIVEAVHREARTWLEYGSDVAPPDHGVSFDRAAVIEAVRDEIALRRAGDA